jgi:hypothetical protein
LQKLHTKAQKSTAARNGGQTNPVTLRSVAIAEIVDSLLLDQKHARW